MLTWLRALRLHRQHGSKLLSKGAETNSGATAVRFSALQVPLGLEVDGAGELQGTEGGAVLALQKKAIATPGRWAGPEAVAAQAS